MDRDDYTRYFPDTWENHSYVMVKEISQGLAGKVYEIESENGRHFAMKKVKLDMALAELDIMSRFRHPHLMEAYEVYREKEYVYIIMPLADNSSFELLRQSNRGIDIEVRIRILYEVISGLNFLQKNGIVHCDIKPRNIMIYNTPDNYINAFAKIGNMELVRYFDYNIKLCQTLAAPEEIVKRGKAILYESLEAAKSMDSGKEIRQLPYDQVKVSMYALGITMAEILSGMEIDYKMTHGIPTYVYYLMKNPSRMLIDMGIDKEWIPLLERLVNTDIDRRPSTFAEVLDYPSFKKKSYSIPIDGAILINSPKQYCDVYMSDAIKMGIEDMTRLNIDISVATLFIEILYRAFPYIVGFSQRERTNQTMIIPLLVSAIIYLSANLIDQNLDQIISRSNLTAILDTVYAIYIQLDGVIYVDTIYNKAPSAQIIKKLLSIAFANCNQYISKSLSEHVRQLEREESAYQRGFRVCKNENRSLGYYIDI